MHLCLCFLYYHSKELVDPEFEPTSQAVSKPEIFICRMGDLSLKQNKIVLIKYEAINESLALPLTYDR